MTGSFVVGSTYTSTSDTKGKKYTYEVIDRTMLTVIVRGPRTSRSKGTEVMRKYIQTTIVSTYGIEVFFPFGQDWNKNPIVASNNRDGKFSSEGLRLKAKEKISKYLIKKGIK